MMYYWGLNINLACVLVPVKMNFVSSLCQLLSKLRPSSSKPTEDDEGHSFNSSETYFPYLFC